MKLSPVLLLLFAVSLSAQQGTREPTVVREGGWHVQIHYEPASIRGRHVTRYWQTVRRFAPDSDDGELIHRETSSGFVRVFLRADGLCFVDPVGKQPFLSFPDGESLTYPLPPSDTCPDWGYDDLNCNGGGRVHFLGDLCVIARQVNARMQVASFEVDLEEHTATPLRSLVDVCGQGMHSQAIARAALPEKLMLRLGDVLFWVNRGDLNSLRQSPSPWCTRALRAFDLEKGELIDPESLTLEWLYPHRDEIYSFIEDESHNVIAEFEMWAIPRFGEGRWTNYTDRLIQLFASISLSAGYLHVGGELQGAQRPLRSVYLEALTKLNER